MGGAKFSRQAAHATLSRGNGNRRHAQGPAISTGRPDRAEDQTLSEPAGARRSGRTQHRCIAAAALDHGHRHRHGRAGRDARGQLDPGDTCEHVDPGADGAGGAGRPPARRWRTRRQRAHRRGSRALRCRYRDRGERGHRAARRQRGHFAVRRRGADGGHPHRTEREPVARRACGRAMSTSGPISATSRPRISTVTRNPRNAAALRPIL